MKDQALLSRVYGRAHQFTPSLHAHPLKRRRLISNLPKLRRSGAEGMH